MKKLEPRARDVHVFVCHGSRCTRNGAPLVRRGLLEALVRLGLRPRASRTSCQGFCKQGCVVFVERPRARVWGRVGTADLPRLAGKIAVAVRRSKDKSKGDKGRGDKGRGARS